MRKHKHPTNELESWWNRLDVIPVEALAVADIWIPPGESQQDVPEFLDAIQVRRSIVLVVRKRPEKIQLYLLTGRVWFIVHCGQKVLVIVFWHVVSHLLHMEVNAPTPHLGTVVMGNSTSHQRLKLWRSNHFSVHGDGQVVVPLYSNWGLLVCQGKGLQVERSLFCFKFFLIIILLWESFEAINIILTKWESKQYHWLYGLQAICNKRANNLLSNKAKFHSNKQLVGVIEAKKNNRSITEIPMVSIKIPLSVSSKTITKFIFVVCFGHFSNRI